MLLMVWSDTSSTTALLALAARQTISRSSSDPLFEIPPFLAVGELRSLFDWPITDFSDEEILVVRGMSFL